MAQDPDKDDYIDVDNTVITPSSQRVRNILTLDERVAAIKAYNHRPMYTKVARMFNCSWEQIKNIISNRDAIMEFYEATKNQKEFNRLEELQMDLKQRKIKFLSECVYEYIQRVQHHMNLPITEELIRLKALEFQDFIKLDDFLPNKKWLNIFKATYNISLANKQIVLTRIPPASMDLKDIMTYCTKNRIQNTNNLIHMKDLKQKYNSLDAKTAEYESRRVRKLNFLQKALNEYLQRAKFHHKSMKVDDAALQFVAQEFNEILKVQDFHPTLTWIRDFKQRHNATDENSANGKRPLLSLDLKDILSYCSRMDNKTKACTITLKPKEPPATLQMHMMPKFPGRPPESKIKYQQNSIIYVDDEEEDVKPHIDEIKIERFQIPEHSPPLKIRKIESINNDPVLQNELRQQHQREVREDDEEYPQSSDESRISIKLEKEDDSDSAATPNPPISSTPSSPMSAEVSAKTSSTSHSIQSITTCPASKPIKSSVANNAAGNGDNSHDDSSELPHQITNFKDALRLLKPLEEYAMLRENYRAIGLITQLEEVLKNSSGGSRREREFTT